MAGDIEQRTNWPPGGGMIFGSVHFTTSPSLFCILLKLIYVDFLFISWPLTGNNLNMLYNNAYKIVLRTMTPMTY
jgi:hypothetical protein